MANKPKLLDLCCAAGGASMGYYRAGFDVVGVDIKIHKRYPFECIQGDALDVLARIGHEFDAIAGSPPCQRHSIMTRGRWQDRLAAHPDLISPMRALMVRLGKPYVIENVIGAPLVNPIMLCGTMFGLQTREGSQLRRHRLFEAPWFKGEVPKCAHNDGSPIGVYGGGQHPQRRRPATIGVWGNAGGSSKRDGLDHYGIDARREAMGIDWMKGKELSEAIPPAYTEFIGQHLIRLLAQ